MNGAAPIAGLGRLSVCKAHRPNNSLTSGAGFSKVHTFSSNTTRGDVAQLGEHCLRKAGVEGSNPFISTMKSIGYCNVSRALPVRHLKFDTKGRLSTASLSRLSSTVW